MVTIAQFRAAFPEFASTANYPDAQVQFWLDVAAKLLNVDRWYDLFDQGAMLFSAHHLVIARRDQLAGSSGGMPGAIQGAVASKSVDKVSVSYQNDSSLYQDAGFWNLTSYGLQYWNLVRMVGAGGIQL
jgi:hypothetical protein